jgi:membrane protein implicated in regulation of membrane protease activity
MDILWWHWLVLGLILVAAELAAAGGFFIIFFGVGAVAVGILAGMGLAGPLWMQLLLFSVISVGGLLLFRSRVLALVQRDPQAPAVDQLVGEIGVVSGSVGPGDIGKVELRGSAWSARNESASTLTSGMRVRVLRVEGLMLHVAPEGTR